VGPFSVRDALHRRAVLEQAKGLVMGVHRCDAADALRILSRAARQHDVGVHAIASGLVDLAANTGTSASGDREPAVTSVLQAALQDHAGVDEVSVGRG
jgi:ANTAR domain-containing protein